MPHVMPAQGDKPAENGMYTEEGFGRMRFLGRAGFGVWVVPSEPLLPGGVHSRVSRISLVMRMYILQARVFVMRISSGVAESKRWPTSRELECGSRKISARDRRLRPGLAINSRVNKGLKETHTPSSGGLPWSSQPTRGWTSAAAWGRRRSGPTAGNKSPTDKLDASMAGGIPGTGIHY